MAALQKEPMPPDNTLENGCIVEFAALSPTTGAAITGVKVSNATIRVNSSTPGQLASGSFELLNPVLISKT